ncbi:uncharacterized protein [Branchiostoma lanceolatum]|uniref:uncharacterized protein n=1 Tax=Branchiostoma lanceolatum TaxID=7740 RepID=UPI00345423EA
MVDTTYLAAVVALVLGTSVEQGGTATPVERPVVEGGSVELRCDIPYVRSEDFHWLRSNDGVILKRWANTQPDEFQIFHLGFQGRVSLEGPDGVDLRINNVRREDEGSYYCQQIGADTSRDGTPQKLLVADAGPRLDSGDIAGISVGAISGIIIVIVATSTITYYCCKRRNQKTILIVAGYMFLPHTTASIYFSLLQACY